MNDWTSFCGLDMTSTEVSVIGSVFKLFEEAQPANITTNMGEFLIDIIDFTDHIFFVTSD